MPPCTLCRFESLDCPAHAHRDEIVLGVDNVVFIAILVGRVSADKRERIRRIGIALALVIRIGLLFTLSC